MLVPPDARARARRHERRPRDHRRLPQGPRLGRQRGRRRPAGRVRLRPRRRERLRGGRRHEDPRRGHGLDELGARHRGGRRRHRGPDLDGARHRPRPRRQAHRAVRADPREVARPHQPGQPQGARVHRVLRHGGLPLRERLGLREARARPRVRQGHGRRLRLHDKGSAPAHAGGARLLLARVEGARRGGASAFRLRREHRYRHRLHLGGPEPPGLRLPGELRHPLEPRAHRAALRPR